MDAGGAADVPRLRLYDCHAEYDMWKTAWTPDWKAWCCEHEQRGCPSTTITTATSSTATTTTRTTSRTSTVTTTTTEGEGCSALCEVDNVNNTCGDRIHWATKNEEREKKHPCAAARALVLKQCSICGGCSLEAVGCSGMEEDEHADAEVERDSSEEEHADAEVEKDSSEEEHADAEVEKVESSRTVVVLKKFEEPAAAGNHIEEA